MNRRFLTLIALFVALVAQAQHDFTHDGYLLNAYLQNNMAVWQAHVDSIVDLPYEYGLCAALMETDREKARTYVQRFNSHIEQSKASLPEGHYAMYKSAVWVFELRLHESFHPAKSLQWARDAVKQAPQDPFTLTYCGMSLFYAPKPFGNKKEALQLFLKAEQLYSDAKWYNCWWRAATMMYIAQCYEKQGDSKKAIRKVRDTLNEYPEYLFLRNTYLPALLKQ